MVLVKNLKEALPSIGFVRTAAGECFTRDYGTCSLSVDFDSQKISYPEEKGLKINDRTTSNFEHPENFVVLECVCRLLEKGYRPEHIELESRWTVGHDAKGGKADILVRNANGQPLLIIECKTWGGEFSKEKKRTEQDGGQLFSYWQQENATQWLALYASEWNGGKIRYKCAVIHCKDDANIAKLAEKESSIKTYVDARNGRERFEVWNETYQKQWLDDVIFSSESQAYKVGIPPLRKGRLKNFTPEDRIVNRFEEILRHNNVSDKENAFNRLVALFICKLVDEIKKQDSDVVDFQYKQGQDTYESLQDRLQHLHQQGMGEFMKETIFYVEADYAERLFTQYTGRQRKAAIEDLNRTIRILKFYSNNDFAFKDVHNEELFYQNGKILVEVVQLFQPYRIVYPSKHQFLGDLFEQLLNKGFKQNEGQFFTPTPITRFIWDSLPLQSYISRHDLPRVIDYACGAGHFLTEAVEAINAAKPDSDNSWVETHIYGIEKDYRLARVSKISMFMNGAGGTNIVFGDGLENYPEKGIAPASFDILVANPPYAVKGFKQHLKLKNNTLSLLDKVSPDGDEIEVLFVERIAQLLKPRGIAAVVLPSSILNDTSSSGIAARECLLKNFYIHTIVALGSQTFGATGTNTVTLFLERFYEPPRPADLANDIVNGIVNGSDADWEDRKVLDEHAAFQKIDREAYLSFMGQKLSESEISSIPYLKGYVEAFRADSVKFPKICTEEEKEQILRSKFYDWAIAVEKEKLYYFYLVFQQRTLAIEAPSDSNRQKDFLGYEWSNRKGQEGIKIRTPGGSLYNSSNRFARGTLACAIRDSFSNAITEDLPDPIRPYAKSYALKDMLDFHVPNFSKAISLTVTKSSSSIGSKYPMRTLQSLMLPINGSQTKVAREEIKAAGKIPVITQEANRFISGYTDKGQPITDIPLIVFGDHSCTLKYVDFEFVRGVDGTQLIKVGAGIAPKFVFEFLRTIDIANPDRYERHFKYLKQAAVPIPPMDVQQLIITECSRIDAEYSASRMGIETYRSKIDETLDRLEMVSKDARRVMISELCEYATHRTSQVDTATYVTTDNMLQDCEGIRPYNGTGNIASAIAYQEGDVLLSNIRPYLKKIWLADREGSCSPDVLVLRPNRQLVDEKFFFYSLRRDAFFDFIMHEAGTKGLKMPRGNREGIMRYAISLPSIAEQRRIAEEVALWYQLIDEAKAVMGSCEGRKKKVVQKYI